jgi:hypothetical protein
MKKTIDRLSSKTRRPAIHSCEFKILNLGFLNVTGVKSELNEAGELSQFLTFA